MAKTLPPSKLTGDKLLTELARFAAKAGRILLNKGSSQAVKDRASTAISLLNHAQGLSGSDDRSARRLLSIAKRAL